MRISGSILLGVIGAILLFAVEFDVAGISISTVGLIMLIAAAVWFAVELGRGVSGNRTVATETVKNGDGTIQQRQQVIEEDTV